CLVVAFFSLSCDLRSLHCFPTRRSSDLTNPGGRHCRRRPSGYPGSRSRRTSWRCSTGWSCCSADRPALPRRPNRCSWSVRAHARSEEHTSELQSRENLVCRLLLEKKKQG